MIIKELLKYVGIDLNSGFDVSGVPLEGIDVNFLLYNLSLMVFIFSIISLLSGFNIILYFIVLLYSDNSKFILNLSNKSPLFVKFLKMYKNSRLSLIIIESLFFVLSTGGMIFISFLILTNVFLFK
jgi:hypothetical protein